MKQRKDKAKQSSVDLIPNAEKISEILDVDFERKAKASYELQDDLSGAWMEEGGMSFDTESEDEKENKTEPNSTGAHFGLKEPKPSQEALKRVSFSFDEGDKQPKTYDLQDEMSSAWMDADMGNLDESEDTAPVMEPVTEKNIKQIEVRQSEESDKKRAYEYQDELSSAWMADDLGTFDDLDEESNETEQHAEPISKPQDEVFVKSEHIAAISPPTTDARDNTPRKAYENLDDMSSAWMADDLGTFDDSDEESNEKVQHAEPVIESLSNPAENKLIEKTETNVTQACPPKTIKQEVSTKKAYEYQDEMSSAWMAEDLGTLDDSDEESDDKVKEEHIEKSEHIVAHTLTKTDAPDNAPKKAYENLDDMSSAWMADDLGTFDDSDEESDGQVKHTLSNAVTKPVEDQPIENSKLDVTLEDPLKNVTQEEVSKKAYEYQDEMSSAWMADDLGTFDDSDEEGNETERHGESGAEITTKLVEDKTKQTEETPVSIVHKLPANVEHEQASKKAYEYQDEMSSAWMADDLGAFEDSDEESVEQAPQGLVGTGDTSKPVQDKPNEETRSDSKHLPPIFDKQDEVLKRAYKIQDEMSSAWMADDLGTFEDSEDDDSSPNHTKTQSYAQVLQKEAMVEQVKTPLHRELPKEKIPIVITQTEEEQMFKSEVDSDGFTQVRRKRTLSQRSEDQERPKISETPDSSNVLDQWGSKLQEELDKKKSFEIQDSLSSAWMADDFGKFDSEEEELNHQLTDSIPDLQIDCSVSGQTPTVAQVDEKPLSAKESETEMTGLQNIRRKRTYSEISQDKIKVSMPEESSSEKKLNYSSTESESKPQEKSLIESEVPKASIQAGNTPGRSFEIFDEMSSAWMNDDLGTFEDSDEEEEKAKETIKQRENPGLVATCKMVDVTIEVHDKTVPTFAEICSRVVEENKQEDKLEEAVQKVPGNLPEVVEAEQETSFTNNEDIDSEGFKIVKRKRTFSQKSNEVVNELKGKDVEPETTKQCEESKPVKAYEKLDDMSSAWMGEDFGCLESSDDETESDITKVNEPAKETAGELEAPRLVSEAISQGSEGKDISHKSNNDTSDKAGMASVDADVLTFAPLWMRRADKKVKIVDKPDGTATSEVDIEGSIFGSSKGRKRFENIVSSSSLDESQGINTGEEEEMFRKLNRDKVKKKKRRPKTKEHESSSESETEEGRSGSVRNLSLDKLEEKAEPQLKTSWADIAAKEPEHKQEEEARTEEVSCQDVKPAVIIVADNDSERQMSVDSQGFQEVTTKRKRRLSSRNDPDVPNIAADVCDPSSSSSESESEEEEGKSSSVKNLTLDKPDEGIESELKPSLSWADIALKVPEHQEEETKGDTHIPDSKPAIIVVAESEEENREEPPQNVDTQGFQEVQTRRRRRLSSRNYSESENPTVTVSEVTHESSENIEKGGDQGNLSPVQSHEGSKTPATPPPTPAETNKAEEEVNAKATTTQGYSRPLIENARRTIWKAVEKARQMERDNNPALSSNEWLKHLAKENKDWSTHQEAAKGELLYAQQRTKDAIVKEAEAGDTQQDDVPKAVRDLTPTKIAEDKSGLSSTQNHKTADVKVDKEKTKSLEPQEPSQPTRNEDMSRPQAADKTENSDRTNDDLDMKPLQLITNVPLDAATTSKSNSDVPQKANSSPKSVPEIHDQPKREEEMPESTKVTQDQEAKTDIPTESEIKMIDDDAASVTSSESSAMPDLAPVTSNVQKQQPPLDVEVKVITEAPRPSSEVTSRSPEVATTTAPAMPGRQFNRILKL